MPYHRIRQFGGVVLLGMHVCILMMLWEKRHDEKEWPINLTCMAVVFCTAVNPELLDTGYQIAIPDRTEGLSTAYTLFRDGLIQQSASTSYPKDPENMADFIFRSSRNTRFFLFVASYNVPVST